MSGVAAPSTLTRLIQSQNINNNSLNIHPPPSTFPTHSQNIINRIDRMKEQEATGDDNDSLTCNKKACLVWSNDLHTKFVAAVNELGLHKAVPKKIVTLMNVQGITTAHVASHLQKYRLRKKKAADTVPAQIYSPSGLNISEVRPSTLVQSQNISNNSVGTCGTSESLE